MPRRGAEFVVIGGGIVGVSMAYWLAGRRAGSVRVLERGAMLGGGSTERSAGGIRAQFSAEVNIRMMVEGIRFFESFKEEIGGEPEFVQAGYLFMVTNPETRARFERSVRLQRSLGLDVRELAPAEIARLAPYVRTDDLIYGTFGSSDGYADPHGVIQALAERARERGAQIEFEVEVTGLAREGDRIVRVETNRGSVEGVNFVVAAGAWSGVVAKMAGAEVPVYPVRRMLFITRPFPPGAHGIPGVIPMTIDMDSGFYMRRESGGLMIGREDESEPPGFETTLDWNWLEAVLEPGLHRVPSLADCEIMRGWAGLYDQSPDHSAVLGRIPGLRNAYVVSGFSGHGFMQGPIASKLVSELIVEGRPSIDIGPLRVERFKENQPIEEANVI